MTSNNVKFIINIEIDNRSHQIVLNPFQDAKQVATSFIKNEQLDFKLVDSLADHIKTFLRAANERAVNRIKFEKNFENKSENENSEEDYNYSLHDSGLTQPEVNVKTGARSVDRTIENDQKSIRIEVNKEKDDNKSLFCKQKRGKLIERVVEKKKPTNGTNNAKHRFSLLQQQQIKNNLQGARKTADAKVYEKVTGLVSNTNRTVHRTHETNTHKQPNTQISLPYDKMYKALTEPEETIYEDLLETNNGIKNLNQTHKINTKAVVDIESKGYYQPTTSYINKLLAEKSPDGTIDIELVKKQYTTIIDSPKNTNVPNHIANTNSANNETRNIRQRPHSATKSVKATRGTQFIDNFNRRFYYEQLNKVQTRQRYLQDVKTLKELENEAEVFSFKPQINEVSDSLAKERKQENIPVEEYLLKRAKETKEKKLNTEVTEKWHKDNEFDFKPQINKTTEEIILKKNLNNKKIFNSKYDELYELAMTKKQELEVKPVIDANANVKASDKSNQLLHNSEIPLNFFERQNYLDQKQKQHKVQLEIIHKPSFRPRLVSKSTHIEVS